MELQIKYNKLLYIVFQCQFYKIMNKPHLSEWTFLSYLKIESLDSFLFFYLVAPSFARELNQSGLSLLILFLFNSMDLLCSIWNLDYYALDF